MSASCRKLLLPLLAALVLPAHLLGQIADPNIDRGITPGKAYSAGDPDTVNLFNGNLNLTIPIGQTYHAGGDLSYALVLHYGGNSWEHTSRSIDYTTPVYCDATGCTYSTYTRTYGWGFPSRRSNAGQGWLLSLGSLWNKFGCPATGPCTFTAYEAPDGSLHAINFTTLHALDPNEHPIPTQTNPNLFYSRDGTYLRYKTTANNAGPQLEFPNGITEVYDPHTGKLTQRYDRFGNWLHVIYDDVANPYCDPSTPNCASTWHLQDSQGRNHYVYFKPGASYYETTSPGQPGQTAQSALVAHEIVAAVVVQTFGGTTATYQFHYEGEGDGSWSTVARQNVPDVHLDPALSCDTPTTLLSSVVLPDASQSSYAMTYDHGYSCTGTQTNAGFNASNILSLTLPTAGKLAWTYHWYRFNNPGIVADPNLSASGVGTRTVYDAAGLPISVTTYDQDINNGAGVPAPESHTTVTVSSGDGATTFSKVTHYFSTCVNTKGGGGCAYPTGEYGLPFSRLQPADSTGTRFLSTQVYAPDASGNWTVPARATYLRYEADEPMNGSKLLDKNRRVVSQRVLYEDGTVADDDYSLFDGLGHYRQQTTGGTFGRADARTMFTNSNPGSGTFVVVNGSAGGYTMWGPSTPWVLDTSTFATVTETLPGAASPTTSMVQTCFDPNTGFLKRKRTLKQPQSGANPSSVALDTTDVLAVFTPSAAGDMLREQYLGGDKGPQPPNDTCNGAVSSEAYRIEHTYSYGSLASSQFYNAGGSALTFKNVDQDIDANTGLVKTSRERADSASSGLITAYKYDALGRLTDVQPSGSTLGGSWTQYVYTMVPPKVDTYHLPNGATSGALKHTATQFDVLGRVWRELEDMPDGSTSIRETLYNGAGWKASVSERETNPTHITSFTYDAFGRPTKVTAPDGSTVTKSYVGSSSVTTMVGVRTGGDATTTTISSSFTTETFDRQGRLWKVTDPAGTLTEYTYDIGDRLAMICMNKSGAVCGQTRTFNYDNRGFLNSEKHPEKGASGNGTTNYYDYDARGHVGRRVDGSASGTFDLSYSYDRAEHLTGVYYTGSGRTLKMFVYGTDNDLAHNDYRNGKLTQAVRFNWFDQYAWNVQIAELYTYAGKDGRISAKTTVDYECALSASSPCTVYPTGTQAKNFTQTFTYDDIGDMISQQYPECHQTGCAGVVPAAPAVTSGFSQGFLTSVTWPGLANPNTIAYWPNGMVRRVTHANNVVDDVELDPDGMRRPASLSTTGAQDASACTAPTIVSNPESTSIASGTQKTLSVGVSSDSNTTSHPVTYQWYNSSTALSGQTAQSLQVNVAGSYWVQVSNGCGSVSSAAAAVTVCQAPAVTTQPHNVTITQGMNATLTVGASGTDRHYQWFWSASGYSVPVGQDSPSLTVSPSANMSYWVQVSNDCGFASSVNASVVVKPPPTAPTLVAFTSSGAAPITIVWSVPTSVGAGLDHYELQREFNGGSFSTFTTAGSGVLSLPDNSVAGLTAYVYRIRAVDTNGIASPWSLPDVATTIAFSNDPVTPRVTPVRGVFISELRQAVDAMRRTANLPPMWTSYAPATGPILASDITDLRDALDPARGVLGLPPVAYTYPSESSGNPIVAADINDLRNGVK